MSGGFWSEHSERNCLASCASAAGVSSDEVDRLGRWSAKQSETYVQTSRVIIEKVQAKVALQIRRGHEGADFAVEASILAELAAVVEGKGWNQDQVQDLISGLKYFGDYFTV
jgi:hypothetical protein